MITLWNRADHYIFILSFVLSSFFFPRLISAAADWMSAILPHLLAENTGRKKVAKNRHLGTITQLCWAISSQLRHVSTIEKKLVKQQCVLHMSSQYGELRPANGWDRSGSLRHPCKFQWVLHLGSITAWHLVVSVSQTLQCWTEGTTYVRQDDHHVGHWPTF